MSGPSILVVQTAFVGDIVLTTPLLRVLKGIGPSARITVLTTPAGGSLLEGSPFVDELVVFRKKGEDARPQAFARIVRALRRKHFDGAVAAHRSFRSGVLTFATRAPMRVGFVGAAGAWSYTRRVEWEGTRHAVHRYLALATPFGVHPETADPHPCIDPSPESVERADALLRGEGIGAGEPLLAVAPGSIWGTKRWTPEGYARVVAESEGRLGLRPVLLGSPEERSLCEEVAARSRRIVADFSGRSDLGVLAALLARSAVLLTNDSGPGHVASAVRTPVVAVFGPTVQDFGYTPFGGANRIVERSGLACRPCHHHGPAVCPLGHHRCMTEIDAETVLRSLASVLGETGRGRPQRDSVRGTP